MTELARLQKKAATVTAKLDKEIVKLTKASKAQLKANALVNKLTAKSTQLTVEKSRLNAMIAAGQNATTDSSLSADGVEGAAHRPASSIELPKFLGEKG